MVLGLVYFFASVNGCFELDNKQKSRSNFTLVGPDMSGKYELSSQTNSSWVTSNTITELT